MSPLARLYLEGRCEHYFPHYLRPWDQNEFVEKARSKKKIIDAKQKVVYDQHSKDLKTLDPNTAVWVQHPETGRWDEEGIVTQQVRKRTYKIELKSGKIIYRNRKRIRKREINPTQSVMTIPKDGSPVYGEHVEKDKFNVRRSERLNNVRKNKSPFDSQKLPKKGM